MVRKRWTAKKEDEVTDSALKFREKRKWQIALRRYILAENKSSFYAPYFGLDIKNFRKWIEIQFDGDMNWENFSKTWQFDHIVPVAYFDFGNEADLRLCWNFVNIRTEKLHLNKNRGHRIDVLAAKAYFEALFATTNYQVCLEMIKKIETIEVSQIESNTILEAFVSANKGHIETIASFSAYEFVQLNNGLSVEEVLRERAFLKHHGSV